MASLLPGQVAGLETGLALPGASRVEAAQPSTYNRLADETSPYLRQHADNPVDWYPWGDEAMEKAVPKEGCHSIPMDSITLPSSREGMNRSRQEEGASSSG